jgi:hypothetical protein
MLYVTRLAEDQRRKSVPWCATELVIPSHTTTPLTLRIVVRENISRENGMMTERPNSDVRYWARLLVGCIYTGEQTISQVSEFR